MQYYQLVGFAVCISDTWAIPEIPEQEKERLTVMGGSGIAMGFVALLAMGLFVVVIVGLVVWLIARPRDRS